MKIWLDLRFISDNLYSAFVIELLKWMISINIENKFIIYTNSTLEWFDSENVTIKNIWIKNGSLKEQFKYLKILKKDKNNIVFFFNHYKPIFYTWNYYSFISSLKDVYYSDFSNYYKKYIYYYLLEKNLKNSYKILCFDKNTSNELIEKFNIIEEKITCIKWFFPNSHILNSLENINVNIRTKYDIKNDYFIYSGWEWVEKNYEKLIYVFEKLKKEWINKDLVLLWTTIARNIQFRNLIIDLNMQNNIHFLWFIKPAEKILFYKKSLWVIFPSFYEPFPFRLTEPLYFNIPIIASNISNIKNIFWDKIEYISAISVNNIYEKIKLLLEGNTLNKTVYYEEIKKIYKVENTINELLETIK